MGSVTYGLVEIDEGPTANNSGENPTVAKRKALDALMDFVNQQPEKLWEDDSRDAVRALVAERYDS